MRTAKSSNRTTHSPGATSCSVAVPRPKWNSSVPTNSPRRAGAGVHGSGVGVGDSVGATVAEAPGSGLADPVGAGVVGATGDGDGSAAATIGASCSSVDRKMGDTRYQPSGTARIAAAPIATADASGWRRATPTQPRRRATAARTTSATIPAIANGTRSAYAVPRNKLPRSPMSDMDDSVRWLRRACPCPMTPR